MVGVSKPKLFLPSMRAATVLAGVGVLALAAALYVRYGIIQNTPLGLACEAGRESVVCDFRFVVVSLFNNNVFGWAAIFLALLNFWRPSVLTFGICLAAALAGLVLYNTSGAALAFALLLLSLARPAP